jgi:endonuclease/exonuclease/phosphatase family metal-dependent hydrolase
LRVVTFNIQDGAIGREARVLNILSALQPDIAILQEVTAATPLDEWGQRLNMRVVRSGGQAKRRVAILSRYPVLASSTRTPFAKLSRDQLEASIQLSNDHSIRVFGVHLAAQPFVIFEGFRQLEIKHLLLNAVLDSVVPCLIAGDFNAVGPGDKPITQGIYWRVKLMILLQGNQFLRGAIRRLITAGFTDSYRAIHDDEGYTLPTQAPSIRFDYIFANEGLRPYLTDCYVAHNQLSVAEASDHLPVVADFDL